MYHRGVFCEKMCICRGSCWHFLHSVEAHFLKRVPSRLVCFSYRAIFQLWICGRQRVWQCYSKDFTSRYGFGNILEKADRETISSCQLPQPIVGSPVFLWIAMKHPVRCLECLNPQDLKDSTSAVHADIKVPFASTPNASLKVQKRCLSFLPKKFPSVSVVLPSSAFELTTAPFKSKWTFAINCLNLSVAWGWVLWIPDLPCGRPWAFKSLFLKWMNNQKCLSSFPFWKFRNSKIFWFAGPGTQKLWRGEQASSNFSRQIRWTCWRKPPAGVKVALDFGKFGILYSIYFPWSPGTGVYWTLRQKADKW